MGWVDIFSLRQSREASMVNDGGAAFKFAAASTIG